jgi:hypothetical protein
MKKPKKVIGGMRRQKLNTSKCDTFVKLFNANS